MLTTFILAWAAAAATPLKIGQSVSWTYDEQPLPVSYRADDLTLVIDAGPAREIEDFIQPRVEVRQNGLPTMTLMSVEVSPVFPHQLGLGLFDRVSGSRFVMWQAYTGGAHCCVEVLIALPDEPGRPVVSVGRYDMEPMAEVPHDVDGDGRADFVFTDNRFLYAFASYSESFAPPQIVNVIGDEALDVSARPSFRPLFQAVIAEQRDACLRPGNLAPNGACAAYVASAARLGRFDEAWREMLRAYDRGSEWGLVQGCRVPTVDYVCPEAQEIRFATYPEALRHFLAAAGYID